MSLSYGDPNYILSLNETPLGWSGNYDRSKSMKGIKTDPKLSLIVEKQTNSRLHIQIFNPDAQYIEIPNVIQAQPSSQTTTSPLYSVSFPDNGIVVTRSKGNDVIFDTSKHLDQLLSRENFVQLKTSINKNPIIYGLGERRTRLALPYPQEYNFIPTDTQTPPDGLPLYGSHPFHIEVAPSGECHGILFLNTYPMQVSLENGSLTYRSMGGKLDIYIFMGPTQKDVMTQYTDLIGRPCLVPSWSMGFHHCRWGYRSLTEVETRYEDHKKAGIPVDCMWFDIDYMDNFKIFTTNPYKFPEDKMNAFFTRLASEGVSSVAIIDPQMSGNGKPGGYHAHEALLESGAYLRHPTEDKPFVGKAWPRECIYPDFTNPASQAVWSSLMKDFLGRVNLTGIWLDMNEPTCFPETSQPKHPTFPWTPGDIKTNNIPMSVRAHCGTHLAAKSLYGKTMSDVTVQSLLDARPGIRPFVLTRSSFIGSGHTHAKWLGDNHSEWPDLVDSISGVVTMGLFGITIIGADIGGFLGNTTPEMMTRWLELGVFLYPFLRNHNHHDGTEQALPAFRGPEAAIIKRYAFVRQYIQSYMYTQMHFAHQTGIPIVRSLSMEFPADAATRTIDTQAMLGDALLVTPVIAEKAVNVTGHFPNCRWYDFWSFEEDLAVSKKGTSVLLDAPLDHIPVHIRGGTVVTLQSQTASTLNGMRASPLTVVCALDEKSAAKGFAILDDGISTNDTAFTRLDFEATSSSFAINVTRNNFQTDQQMEKLVITGLARAAVTRVRLNAFGHSFTWSYHAEKGILTIKFDNPVKLVDGINLLF
ncbi:putative Lysosomal alpha-glucosidase [Blattamonas nauphoetae]|uniref:Maltase n=1 Tax=Blattamonas nauphoetae TaxID=2049346 RepID=A0ABQ9Y615_9EUKA|nr:putative Lysosomal alpha-glucosidase [Blattamonas nauphoetae]